MTRPKWECFCLRALYVCILHNIYGKNAKYWFINSTFCRLAESNYSTNQDQIRILRIRFPLPLDQQINENENNLNQGPDLRVKQRLKVGIRWIKTHHGLDLICIFCGTPCILYNLGKYIIQYTRTQWRSGRVSGGGGEHLNCKNQLLYVQRLIKI